jgi:hypothetical protein
VPPEELFGTVALGPSAHPQIMKSLCLPFLLTLNFDGFVKSQKFPLP